MFPFRIPYIPLFCTAGLLAAQTPLGLPATGASPPAHPPDEIHRLDKLVVSAGLDHKAAFDLAQGTSVLTGEELHRLVQATLGETLNGIPGVASTYYGPGASRPIIRGLGGDRIRVLTSGIGALDAANVSPDHRSAVEPLFASRIEVLRGPSTLLYGSSAVGGAVNVINNNIPDTAPEPGALRGAAEIRGGGPARERAAVISAGGGTPRFATHINALKQRTRDLRIPGVARIDSDAPADQPAGTLPGSASETSSGSVGGTMFWGHGRAGGAISRSETEYGVPNGEDISIRMRQTRFDLEGSVTQPFGVFRSAKARLGAGDYTHSEVAGAATVNTTFTNKAWEGRLELAHAARGGVTGTIGLQGMRSDFAAEGEEVVTPPSLTQSGAVFALESLKLGEKVSVEIGGRVEGQKIKLGRVSPELPMVTGYAARSGQIKKFAAPSGSVGLVVRPAKDWSIGANLAYTERVPTVQELFSNGPHGGTGTYEVGSAALGNEKSTGFDVSVRRRAGFVTGALSGFVNRFDGYIFEEKLPANALPMERTGELTPFQFVARNATFQGYEAELSFHLVDQSPRHVHLNVMTDYVRAEQTTDHQPLPRIPPRRHSVSLAYDDGRLGAEFEVRHAVRQNRFTEHESATPASTVLNLSVTYLIPTKRVSFEVFARGTNLTDEEVREHTSFLKEFAPQSGRGVLGGVRMTF